MKASKVHRIAQHAKADWRSPFASSTDLFAFVTGAAGPACHGDGAAALYVARAVKACERDVARYGHTADPPGVFDNCCLSGVRIYRSLNLRAASVIVSFVRASSAGMRSRRCRREGRLPVGRLLAECRSQ